jgi:hypothetical protein
MPVTPKEFRRIALSFPETEEREHMEHPDFRVRGKIFATLGYPDRKWGMVKLTPVEQEMLIASEPEVFAPAAGAWGRRGSTLVRLAKARKRTLETALAAAWRGTAPRNLVAQIGAAH